MISHEEMIKNLIIIRDGALAALPISRNPEVKIIYETVERALYELTDN